MLLDNVVFRRSAAAHLLDKPLIAFYDTHDFLFIWDIRDIYCAFCQKLKKNYYYRSIYLTFTSRVRDPVPGGKAITNVSAISRNNDSVTYIM